MSAETRAAAALWWHFNSDMRVRVCFSDGDEGVPRVVDAARSAYMSAAYMSAYMSASRLVCLRVSVC
eukprot:1532434-Rhodomonas_salina.1